MRICCVSYCVFSACKCVFTACPLTCFHDLLYPETHLEEMARYAFVVQTHLVRGHNPPKTPTSAESRLSGVYRIYHIHFVRYPVPDEMFHIRFVPGAALSAGQIRQIPASERTCRLVRNMSVAVKREPYKLLPFHFFSHISQFLLFSS